MHRFAQVGILAADLGPGGRQLRINERAEQRGDTPDQPGRHDEQRRPRRAGDDRWSDEDARADDPAHHDHGRVERTNAACERGRAVAHLAKLSWERVAARHRARAR